MNKYEVFMRQTQLNGYERTTAWAGMIRSMELRMYINIFILPKVNAFVKLSVENRAEGLSHCIGICIAFHQIFSIIKVNVIGREYYEKEEFYY